jgi:PAS domain S-box-containing protein
VSTELFDARTFGTAEEAMEFLGHVLESATEYTMVATDPDGAILLWNEGARRLYGYEPDEIVGRSWTALHTDEDVRAGLPQDMADRALREGRWEGTVQRVRKDGSSFTASVVVTPRRGDGRLAGFLLISRDISAQVQLNRELEGARSLLEFVPDAMVLFNAAGEIQLTNAETTRLFGYSRAELVGHPVEMLIPERSLGRYHEHRAQFFADPRVRPMGSDLDLWGRRKDGTEFPVEMGLGPVETEEGLMATAAIRDVTERKHAEGKFHGLLESAPDAMVIVNEDGEIQLANSATAALFGYSREELVGGPVERLIPPRYHDRHPDHRAEFFAEPRARPMGAGLDLWGRRKDGVEFPVEISLSPLQTEEGLLATAAIRDVTEGKRFEGELRDANVQLEEAAQAKDRFLASMSHELRTPLNAILGFTGMLLMELPGPLNHDQANQLRTVENSGKHLLSLINDLLDLARIESGKLELHIEPIEGLALLEEVGEVMRPLANEKGLDLEVVAPQGGAQLRSDRRALRQILINLSNNAIKFTDEGHVRLELTRRVDGGEPTVRFNVVDTGRGIAADDQASLFAAFEQIGSESAGPYEGTGLGLYICQTLAPLLGATITFDSEPGRGTTFTLELGE